MHRVKGFNDMEWNYELIMLHDLFIDGFLSTDW